MMLDITDQRRPPRRRALTSPTHPQGHQGTLQERHIAHIECVLSHMEDYIWEIQANDSENRSADGFC